MMLLPYCKTRLQTIHKAAPGASTFCIHNDATPILQNPVANNIQSCTRSSNFLYPHWKFVLTFVLLLFPLPPPFFFFFILFFTAAAVHFFNSDVFQVYMVKLNAAHTDLWLKWWIAKLELVLHKGTALTKVLFASFDNRARKEKWWIQKSSSCQNNCTHGKEIFNTSWWSYETELV